MASMCRQARDERKQFGMNSIFRAYPIRRSKRSVSATKRLLRTAARGHDEVSWAHNRRGDYGHEEYERHRYP
jgi:hypothetical protein